MKPPIHSRTSAIPPAIAPKATSKADARRKEPKEVLGRHKNDGQKDHKGAR